MIGLGDANWTEGQRVMWLTKMQAAISRAVKGSKINSKKALDTLLPLVVEGGDNLIKRYQEKKTPIQAMA